MGTLNLGGGAIFTGGSGGFLSAAPKGTVIQTVVVNQSGQVTFTSGYTTIFSGSITTKIPNSQIVINAVLPHYVNNTHSNTWSASLYIRLYETPSGGSEDVAAGYEHPGPYVNQEFSQVIGPVWISDAQPVNTYTYTWKGKPTTGNDTHYFGRTADGMPGNCRMTIQEIAP